MAEELAKRVLFTPILSQQLMQKHVESIQTRYNSATNEERDAGINWYRRAHEEAFKIGKGDVKKGAGIISALSPSMEWTRNIRAAKELVSKGTTSHHMAHVNTVDKAKRILDGEDPDTLFSFKSGPKTLNFYQNISDPENPHPITIDRHAYDIAVDTKGEMTHVLKGQMKGPKYRHFADAYRNAAHELGMPIPNQVQAVTWGTQLKGRQANG